MLINKNDGYINKNIEITDLLVNRLFYSEDYILGSIINIMTSILEDNLIEDRYHLIDKIIMYLKAILRDIENTNIKREYDIQFIDRTYYASKLAKVVNDTVIKEGKVVPKTIEDWKKYSLGNPLRDIQNLWK